MTSASKSSTVSGRGSYQSLHSSLTTIIKLILLATASSLALAAELLNIETLVAYVRWDCFAYYSWQIIQAPAPENRASSRRVRVRFLPQAAASTGYR